jgi:simple sugar transport system ATP-binding protein
MSSTTLAETAKTALELRGISKRFGSLAALSSVSLDVQAGEVHCLLGENGAGKSTLCNVIFGVHRPDEGSLKLLGRPFAPESPAHALASGVAMVHQHFSLVGNMTALENMSLGRGKGRLAPAAIAARAHELSTSFGLVVNLEKPVEDLSVGERQRVEILKCLLSSPKFLVLDEPTAVLPPKEVGALLAICREVAARGCGVVLVTHKLAEIAAIAQRTSVLRRGEVVESVLMKDADMPSLLRAMVGRDVRPLAAGKAERGPKPASTSNTSPAPSTASEESGTTDALVVQDVVVRDAVGVVRLDVSLKVKRGEIVGLAGVEGNGQPQLGAVLAGLLRPTSGRFRVGGRDFTHASPKELTAAGVGIVPEDRHAVACVVPMSIAENLFLGELGRFSRWGLVKREKLLAEAAARMKTFDVRAPGPAAPMSSLSGGNQQKAVLARELTLPNLQFLLAAQPTRGLDVGAVEAVYGHIRAARDRGVGVLLISSELDELLDVADRILVLYRGRIVGELPAAPESRDAIGALMSGQIPASDAGPTPASFLPVPAAPVAEEARA